MLPSTLARMLKPSPTLDTSNRVHIDNGHRLYPVQGALVSYGHRGFRRIRINRISSLAPSDSRKPSAASLATLSEVSCFRFQKSTGQLQNCQG